MNARRAGLAPVLAVLILSSGCISLRRTGGKDAKAGAAQASADSAGADASIEATEASLRGKTFKESAALKPVRFDYDRSILGPEALAALKENAAWLREHDSVEVQVQGHCDERGTIEYNLALGQRRAQAVRDYYRSLGIRMKRMSTLSLGREQPVCGDATEACWTANRRAETRARVGEEPEPRAARKRRR